MRDLLHPKLETPSSPIAVTIVAIDGDRVTTKDKFGIPRDVSMTRRGAGPPPRLGERWIIDRSLGLWTLAAVITSKPASVTGERADDAGIGSLLGVLEEAGMIVDETTVAEPLEPIPSVDDPWGGEDDYEFNEDTTSLPAGWSWLNQGPATYRERYGAGLVSIPGGSAQGFRGLVRSLPPATWTMTSKMGMAFRADVSARAGWVLRDSSNGKLVFFGFDHTLTLVLEQWTDEDTWSSTPSTQAWLGIRGIVYLRVIRLGANLWSYLASSDGIAWRPAFSNSNPSAFLVPGQIGFVANSGNTFQADVSCHWMRFE